VNHALIRIPVYAAAAICVNLVMTDFRRQWKESSKQRKLTHDLAMVHQLTTYIASTHDIKAICDTVVFQLCRSFGYRYAGVYLLHGDRLKLMAQNGYERIATEVFLAEGALGRVVQTGKGVLVPDTSKEPGSVRASEGIRCQAAAPILGIRGPQDFGGSEGIFAAAPAMDFGPAEALMQGHERQRRSGAKSARGMSASGGRSGVRDQDGLQTLTPGVASSEPTPALIPLNPIVQRH